MKIDTNMAYRLNVKKACHNTIALCGEQTEISLFALTDIIVNGCLDAS